MSQALCFNDVQFDVIPQNSQPWVRGYQIGTALGYGENADVSVRKLFTRHADEFTPAMTAVVKLPSEGGEQETRIFSLRGCHLLAMFARTPVAKEFRKWVLDVLDKLAEQERAKDCENVKQIHAASCLSTPASRKPLRSLVNAWALISGTPHTALWPQVKAHFGLERIDHLPESWISDALDFVQEKIDGCAKASAPASPASPALPAASLPAADATRLPMYRNGSFYPPRKSGKHVAGPKETALMDFWQNRADKLSSEIEAKFKAILDDINSAAGDIFPQAVSALGHSADTMFSVSCLLEGLYAAENMARESLADALRFTRIHMRMATSISVALNQ